MRKRRRESRQAGIRKASESDPLMKHRKTGDDIKTGVCVDLREESGGNPFTGQMVSGVKAARAWSAATARNVGRRVPIRRSGTWEGIGGERECVEQQKLRGVEY